MVSENNSARKKGKPRGRPFTNGNHRGKITNPLLGVSGRESSFGRETIDKNENEGIKPSLNDKYEIKKMNIDINEESNKNTENEEMETIDFVNGENKIKIILYKTPNRMFKVKIFLNEMTEIRPLSFQSHPLAMGYWNLLKKSIKKE